MKETSDWSEYPSLENKMIIYSDGGCRGDNRFTGWGCFTEVQVTDSKSDLCRIASYGSVPAPSTNQVAELVAATKAIELATKHEVKDLTVRTDSKYVIEGLTKHYANWTRNGYKNSQGNPIANKDYWDTIANTRKAFVTGGGRLKMEWVKGHSGNLGNEWADKLATLGVGLSSQHPDEMTVTSYKRVDKSVPEMPKKAGKYKFNYNRMHTSDFLYFRVGELPEKDSKGFFTYYGGKMEGLDELGVLAAENKLSVIKIKAPLPLINEVATVHEQMDNNHLGLVGQIITRHLYQAKVAEAVDVTGITSLQRVGLCYSHTKEKPTKNGPYRGKGNWREKDDLYYDDKCITYIANPPRNSFKLFDQLGELEAILNRYIKDKFEGNEHIIVEDVSSEVYDRIVTKNKKGIEKVTYKAAVALGPPATTYTHTTILNKKKYKTKFRLGLDFPARNDLSGILKGKAEVPTVSLIYIIKGGVANWYTIIESEGEYGIYAAQCSNLIIL